MILIKGIQKTTLIDYPDNVASIIFVGKCDFRCPYCYNRDLVLDWERLPTIKEEEVLGFLKKRKKYYDGVVITGGEPTIYKDLPKFIKKIKKIGLKVKLDSNGSNPAMLKELIEKRLVDYIAMDIKAPLEKYDRSAGVKVNKEKIKESVELIKKGKVEYEFRTTVLPEFFSKEDAKAIGEWLKGAKRYYIQQFRPMESCIDPSFKNKKAYSLKELEELRDSLKGYVGVCEIRGAC